MRSSTGHFPTRTTRRTSTCRLSGAEASCACRWRILVPGSRRTAARRGSVSRTRGAASARCMAAAPRLISGRDAVAALWSRQRFRMPSDIRRALIADDEALARERMRFLLARHPHYEIVGEASTGTETIDAIVRLEPDVIFLDIRMPGLSGIEVAQAIDAADGPPATIVFVTAHHEFALAAFDVNAADYLLKPVDRDRFDRALERVEARVRGDARDVSRFDPAMRSVLERLHAEDRKR